MYQPSRVPVETATLPRAGWPSLWNTSDGMPILLLAGISDLPRISWVYQQCRDKHSGAMEIQGSWRPEDAEEFAGFRVMVTSR